MSGLASVVRMVKVSRRPPAGFLQLDQRPAKAKGSTSSKWISHWKLALARPLLPLVEAVGGNQATLLLEAVAVGGLVGDALGSRVDHAVADARLFRPVGDEPPAERFQGARGAGLADEGDRGLLGGRQVVARVVGERRHGDLEEVGDDL